MFRLALPCALVAFLALLSQARAGVLTDWTYGIATHYGGAQEGMNPVSFDVVFFVFLSLSCFALPTRRDRCPLQTHFVSKKLF